MSALARPARQESLRHHNLGLVLRHVLAAPSPVSRADVAAATGLTRATVSSLVDRLIGAGFLEELAPVASQRAGRPAVPLVPARGTVVAVGMEVNVDYVGLRVVDLSGQVVGDHVEPGDFRGSDPAEVLDLLAALAGPVMTGLSARGVPIAGCSLALPGLVDSVTGPLRVAPNLGWRDVDVVAHLSRHPVMAQFPPRLANEANLAARAEAHARRWDGSPSFIYVSGEVGVGGAIVLGGEIFAGTHGWSGEIGHTVLGTAGGPDEGGSLESYAGQDAIVARAGLPRSTPVRTLAERAAGGDPLAREALEVAGAALGTALANVANTVDVGHVVLGGIYGELADHLRAPVTEQMRRRVIWAPWSPVRVDVAVAGQHPAMAGGARAVLETLVEDPAAWAGPDVAASLR